MANYSNLKAAIADAIKTNGTKAITGQVLQDTLNSIVSVIGANYQFAGVATPATNPGTPDQNVFYFATETGLYPNFGGVNLERRSLYLLMWNGSWHVDDSLGLDDIYEDYIQQFINLLEQYQPIVIEGNVVNAPDEEDLTSVNNLLKFKNKSYFHENFSGLGRVFLRKNIVNGENVLTQAMMSESNTIYIIQYDYTLGEDITIPANCVLEFDGGSLSNSSGNNYTITYDNTLITGNIIFNSIHCLGTLKNKEIKPRYYSDDLTYGLNKALHENLNKSYTILIDENITLNSNLVIENNSQYNHFVTILGIGEITIDIRNYQIRGAIDTENNIFPGNIRFENIKFTATSAGASHISINANTLLRITFHNCSFTNMQYAIGTQAPADAPYVMQDYVISDCFVRSVDRFIYNLTNSYGLNITNTRAEQSVHFVMSLGTAYGWNIANCLIEGISGNAIKLAGSVEASTIRDNYFEANKYQINLSEITRALSLLVEGNIFIHPDATNGVINLPNASAFGTIYSGSQLTVIGNTVDSDSYTQGITFYTGSRGIPRVLNLIDFNNRYNSTNYTFPSFGTAPFDTNIYLYTIFSSSSSPTIMYPLAGHTFVVNSFLLVEGSVGLSSTHTFSTTDITNNSFRIVLDSGDPNVIEGKLVRFILKINYN